MYCLCVSLAIAGAGFTLEKQLRNQLIYKYLTLKITFCLPEETLANVHQRPPHMNAT